jgi:hypothetical protein
MKKKASRKEGASTSLGIHSDSLVAIEMGTGVLAARTGVAVVVFMVWTPGGERGVGATPRRGE